MTATLSQPFDDLVFLSPLSPARAEGLADFLADGLHGVVLDVGCGWGELLLRTLAVAPDATGIGVDTNEPYIEHGRRLAQQRGLSDRVTLRCGDGRSDAPPRADAVICVGSSQIWGPPVEDNLPLDYASALGALRTMVTRGARVVYGEGIWSRPPTPQAVAPLAGRLDELMLLPEVVEIAVSNGFLPVAVHEATADEWDEFESGFAARYATWLAAHGPDHPDAAEITSRAARQRAGYYNGYRGTMGMAYLNLVAV